MIFIKKTLQLILGVLAGGFVFGIIIIGMLLKQLGCSITRGLSDFYMNRINQIAEYNQKVVSKKQKRQAKRGERRNFRLEKISLITQKAYAVAAKRKWLVALLGLGIIIYFIVSGGGFSSFGGILDKVKVFF